MPKTSPFVCLVLPWALSLAGGVWGDEEIVFTRGGDLWIMGPQGQNKRALTQTDVREESPHCSPDGELIAYQVYDASRRMYDIWVIKADGTNPHTFVANGHSPAWSPSCGRLAFVSRRSGSPDLWAVDREEPQAIRLTSSPEVEIAPAWSPLGDRLAFLQLHYRKNAAGERTGCISKVMVRELNGSIREVRRLEGIELSGIAWAPGDKWLLAGTRFGASEVHSMLWSVAPTGEGLERLTVPDQGSESHPAWAPGGHWWAFVRQEGIIHALWRQSQAPAPPLPLTDGQQWDDSPAFLPRGASRALRVFIRDQRTYFTPAPHLVAQEILAPARPVCQALGIELHWDSAAQTLELLHKTHRVLINLRYKAAKRNGQSVRLGVFPRVISGVTMVPLLRLKEWLDLPVQWDPRERLLRLGD